MSNDFDGLNELFDQTGSNPGFSDKARENVARQESFRKYGGFIQKNLSLFPYENVGAYTAHLVDDLFLKAVSAFGNAAKSVAIKDVAQVQRRLAAGSYGEALATLKKAQQAYGFLAANASAEKFEDVVGDFESTVRVWKTREHQYYQDGLIEIKKSLGKKEPPEPPVPPKPKREALPALPANNSFTFDILQRSLPLGGVNTGWFLDQLSRDATAAQITPTPRGFKRTVAPIDEQSSLWTKHGAFLEESVLSDVKKYGVAPETSLKNVLSAIGLKVDKNDFKPLLARIVQSLGVTVEEEVVENGRSANKTESEFSKRIKEQGKATRKRIKELLTSLQSLGLEKVGLRLPLEEDLKPLSKKSGRAFETAQTIRDILQKHQGLGISDIEKAAKFYGMPFDRYIADRFLFANREALGVPSRPDLDALLGVPVKSNEVSEKETAFAQFKERLEGIGLSDVGLSLPSDDSLRGMLKRQDEVAETFSALVQLRKEFPDLNLKDYSKAADYKGLFFSRDVAKKLNVTNPGVFGVPSRPDLDALLGANTPIKPKSLQETRVDDFLAELEKEVGSDLTGLGLNPYDRDTAARIVRDRRGKQAIESIKTYSSIIQERPGIGLGAVEKIAKLRGVDGFSRNLIRALGKNNVGKNLDGGAQGQDLLDLEAIIRETLNTDSGESELVAAQKNAKYRQDEPEGGKENLVLGILRAFGRQGVAPKIGGVVEVFKNRASKKDGRQPAFEPVASKDIRDALESVADQISAAKNPDGSVDVDKVNLEEAAKAYRPGVGGIFGAGYDIARKRRLNGPDPINPPGGGSAAFWGRMAVSIAAISAFTLAIKKAINAVTSFGAKTLETVSKYAPYSGVLAEANARYKGREFWRNVEYSKGVEGTTSELSEVWNDLLDSSVGLRVAFTELFNEVGILVVSAILPAIKAINDAIDRLKGGKDKTEEKGLAPWQHGVATTGPSTDFASKSIKGAGALIGDFFGGIVEDFKEAYSSDDSLNDEAETKKSAPLKNTAATLSSGLGDTIENLGGNGANANLLRAVHSVDQKLGSIVRSSNEIVRNTEQKPNPNVTTTKLYNAIVAQSELRAKIPGIDDSWRGKIGHERRHGRDAQRPETVQRSTNNGINKQ